MPSSTKTAAKTKTKAEAEGKVEAEAKGDISPDPMVVMVKSVTGEEIALPELWKHRKVRGVWCVWYVVCGVLCTVRAVRGVVRRGALTHLFTHVPLAHCPALYPAPLPAAHPASSPALYLAPLPWCSPVLP